MKLHPYVVPTICSLIYPILKFPSLSRTSNPSPVLLCPKQSRLLRHSLENHWFKLRASYLVTCHYGSLQILMQQL